MCWISKNETIKQVADEDIPVFKIAIHDGTDILSIYRHFKYKKETVYSTKIGEVSFFPEMWIIRKGFHSYSNDCELIIKSIRIWVTDIKGYYLDDYYPESKRITLIDGNKYVSKYIPNLKYIRLKCIIPKGSEYYLNERGEYVSNQIKVIDYYVLDNLKSSSKANS